ncbi:MAG: putative toxin-antitoxin system toxin component, PIN family [Burkholderiales bacterium]|nr:putative toxin-antitoxin system toxin component, PIN family [Burkholderiales bacterium]
MTGRRPAPRVVLDTNVLVAILAFDDPALEPLRAAWREGVLVPLMDAECQAELERVLAYTAIAGRARGAQGSVAAFLERCERVADGPLPCAPLPRCRDEDDQKFIALAGRGRANALLTRDRLLLDLARSSPFSIVAPEAVAARLAQGAALDDCLALPPALG